MGPLKVTYHALHIVEKWEEFWAHCEVPQDISGEIIIAERFSKDLDYVYWLRRASRLGKQVQAFFYDPRLDKKIPMDIRYRPDHFSEDSFNPGQSLLPKLPLTKKGRQRALFLDRDGIVNVDKSYVFRPSDVEFMPGLFELLTWARDNFDCLIVLTNQSGVGRGHYGLEDVESLHLWMDEELKKRGIALDGWYYSPYHPDSSVAHLKKESYTRKPGAGMALMAHLEHNIDLSRSVMIGDKQTDYLEDLQMKTILKSGDYPLNSDLPIFSNLQEILSFLK